MPIGQSGLAVQIKHLTFIKAVRQAFRRSFDISGRSRRSEYWWFQLFIALLIFASAFFEGLIEGVTAGLSADVTEPGGLTGQVVSDWIAGLIYYILLPTLMTLTMRRLHDIGRSGTIGVISLIAYELVERAVGSPIDILWQGVSDLQSNTQSFTLSDISALALSASVLFLTAYVFYLTLLDGQKRDNKYGVSPKYGPQSAAFD